MYLPHVRLEVEFTRVALKANWTLGHLSVCVQFTVSRMDSCMVPGVEQLATSGAARTRELNTLICDLKTHVCELNGS